jgi:hypothetical protein
MFAVVVFACGSAYAQNVAQPWHEPYVAQLVRCRDDPTNAARSIGSYTFDGVTLNEFVFPKGNSGCPWRFELTPQPQAPATQNPRRKPIVPPR